MTRGRDRLHCPARRRLLAGSLLVGLGAGATALLGAAGRGALAQSKPTVTVYKSPT